MIAGLAKKTPHSRVENQREAYAELDLPPPPIPQREATKQDAKQNKRTSKQPPKPPPIPPPGRGPLPEVPGLEKDETKNAAKRSTLERAGQRIASAVKNLKSSQRSKSLAKADKPIGTVKPMPSVGAERSNAKKATVPDSLRLPNPSSSNNAWQVSRSLSSASTASPVSPISPFSALSSSPASPSSPLTNIPRSSSSASSPNSPSSASSPRTPIHNLSDIPRDLSSLTVSQLGDVLVILGMGSYSHAFKWHSVDGQLLMSLTDRDSMIQMMQESFQMQGLEALKLFNFAQNGWRPQT